MENTIANSGSARAGNTWLIDIFWIVLLSCTLYLALSFTRPLASPDEGRYSEIPREMIADNDYVTPRLNGMQYFYKPPMFYWMQAASIKYFGINRLSLRMANSLMAVFGIVVTYAAARLLFNRATGIFSALVLSTSALYLAMGQIITLDMTVSVFMAASLFSFIVAIKRSGVWRWSWGLAMFAFAGAAVMSKGLIGVIIPCAIVFIYMLAVGWKNFWSAFKISDLKICLVGLVLFAAIVIPWHVLASIANPPYENAEGIFSKKWEGQGFFWYYIIHEHFLRYIDASTSMRYQPVWFFFLFAPVGLIPWIVFAPRAVATYIKDSWGALRTKNSALLYMLLWSVFIVCFFSISKSKLVPYIVPIYPALAVLMGWWFAKWWKGECEAKAESWILVALGYIGAIALVPAYLILNGKGKIFDPQYTIAVMGVCAGILVAGTSISLSFLLRRKTKAFIVGIFATVFCFFMCFNPLGKIFQRPSAQALVEKILPDLKPQDDIVIYTDYGIYQDLPVWANRLPVCVGEPPEEQKFGFMRERQKHEARFLNGDAGFKKFAGERKGTIYIFTRRRDVEEILRQNPSAKEVACEGFMVLLKLDGKKDGGK